MSAKKPTANNRQNSAKSPTKAAKKAVTKSLQAEKPQLRRKSVVTTETKRPSKLSTSTAVALVKPVAVSSQSQAKVVEWELVESRKEELIKDWAARLNDARYKIQTITQQYKKLMLNFLQEAYAVYAEVETSDFADEFYANVRWQLKTNEIKIQSNTPDAGLVIRYVCGSEISTKSISDYSRVLEGAKHNNITPDTFVDWVKRLTMTKVIEDQRALENNKETYADRLKRARLVVLRLIETREVHPIVSQKTTAWDIQKELSPEGLWVAIGTARRRYDRESFYADINLNLMLPPSPDLEIYIVNYLAKPIVHEVEIWEQKINEFEEKIWADELWEKVVSAGYEESEKRRNWWANKQQASRFEDQGEFMDFVKSKQKKK